MFMRHPAYLGEDSGSQAIAGESSRIVKQSWNNPKIVSQTVSHWLSAASNSLLHTQLEMEARVGIGEAKPVLPPGNLSGRVQACLSRLKPTQARNGSEVRVRVRVWV